jgi:hypothetical protein
MSSDDALGPLAQALSVIAYRWEVHGDRPVSADAIHAVEALQAETAAFPAEALPLAELYPRIVRLAGLSLTVLAALGDPDEVDGLHGFEGYGLWRQGR